MPPTSILDSKGDLHLVVGSYIGDEIPRSFLVCSKALARASPVFDQMIFGPVSEPRQAAKSAWVLHLPDDEPTHLAMVLNIMHSNFKNVPQKFTAPFMSGMVAIADKYDCVEIFRPWVRPPWATPLYPGLDVDSQHDPKFSLHVAWQLGCTYSFKKALSIIVDASFISEAGEISIVPKAASGLGGAKEGEPQNLYEYLGDLVPIGVVEQIRDHRTKRINLAMVPFTSLHESLTNKHLNPPCHSNRCNSILLGSLIRGFLETEMGSPTRDAAQRYCGTVNALQQSLDGINLMRWERTCGTWSSCSKIIHMIGEKSVGYQDFEKRSEAIALLPGQKKRLDRQAVKSGLL